MVKRLVRNPERIKILEGLLPEFQIDLTDSKIQTKRHHAAQPKSGNFLDGVFQR
jgi:hypothetical protein